MSGDHNDYHMKVEVVKDNWKYDPITGEPLINGYPLHSGLPKKVWGNWMSDEFDRRDNLQKLTDHDGDLRFTKDETNELIEALEEAVHFIVPTEKDMQRRAGVRRIVKALEKLKEKQTNESLPR